MKSVNGMNMMDKVNYLVKYIKELELKIEEIKRFYHNHLNRLHGDFAILNKDVQK